MRIPRWLRCSRMCVCVCVFPKDLISRVRDGNLRKCIRNSCSSFSPFNACWFESVLSLTTTDNVQKVCCTTWRVFTIHQSNPLSPNGYSFITWGRIYILDHHIEIPISDPFSESDIGKASVLLISFTISWMFARNSRKRATQIYFKLTHLNLLKKERERNLCRSQTDSTILLKIANCSHIQ